MKKIIFLAVISFFFVQTAISQQADHTNGSDFFKRIEYNILAQFGKYEPGITQKESENKGEFIYRYNLESKSILERMLFGNTNSFIEFVSINLPHEGTDDVTAFRIIRNSKTGSYQLEVMQIPEYNHVFKTDIDYLSQKSTKIDIPREWLREIPAAIRDSISKHNKEVAILHSRHISTLFESYRPKTKEYKVSNRFAETLHDNLTELIDNFKAEGMPPTIRLGGYNVIFRCVVGDEVWTLSIEGPQRRALQLYDICRQIITDALDSNKINELQYIRELEKYKKFHGK